MKRQNIVSWIALALSIIACIVTWVRVDVTVANDSFISMIAGFMGVCATLLVGSQIYNSIETSRKIKELDEKLKKTECNFLKSRERNKEFEHYVRYRLYLQVGQSMQDNEPIFAFRQLFYALDQALHANNSAYVSNSMAEIKICCNKILKNNPFKPYSKFNYEKYSPEKLKDYALYPLIKDNYKKYYESIVNLYKQCQEQSETAS